MSQEAPEQFHLPVYLSQYKGRTRIAKALFIASHCSSLEIAAYRAALEAIEKDTRDIAKYDECLKQLNAALERQQKPGVIPNIAWLEADRSTGKLESELRAYKSKNQNEAARLALLELGDYQLSLGDLHSARESYSRTRTYCTEHQHNVEMCFRTIKMYFEAKEFLHAYTFITRAETALDMAEKKASTKTGSKPSAERLDAIAQLKCYKTLALLAGTELHRFKMVAKTLKDIHVDSKLDILAPSDVAIYGGLCALASFNRSELKELVSTNANFKGFLDLEPCIREMMETFLESKFTVCLKLLDTYRANMSLDMYLHPHIQTILTLIREKALVQYCVPYVAIDMRLMAKAFEMSVDQLEDELVTLITKEGGGITARIDSLKKILYTKRQEKRNQAFQTSLEAGTEYEKSAKALLLRLELVKKGMIVQSI